MTQKAASDLSAIPSVEKVKKTPAVADLLTRLSDDFVTGIVREVLDELRSARKAAKTGAPSIELDAVAHDVTERIRVRLQHPLRRVINATGIIIHTNLGRSILGDSTVVAIADSARHYCDLEMDLSRGERGHRDTILEPLLCALTGAEASTIVNNNAAAVMIALDTLAKGGEVITSRGELVEIGGSFRIPDVMEKSGAKLVEVGTTNRTHIEDYERALSPDTALLLKIHQSNYKIVGFTHEVKLDELVELGQKRGIPVMEDLGSGALVDVSRFGLGNEPMPQASIKAGVDIVTFSGDKLLGGSQAGIILGKAEYIRAIRKNPLMRALRVDKLTLSALGSILQTILSSREPEKEIPTLSLMARSVEEISRMIEDVREKVETAVWDALQASIVDGESQVGGGSCPEKSLPTRLLVLRPDDISPDGLASHFRQGTPSILGIIRDNCFCLDFRTVQSDEVSIIADALRNAAKL